MNQIPDLVMLACQDLLASVMQVNNESTHTANLTYKGAKAGVTVTVYKTDESSFVMYDEDIDLSPSGLVSANKIAFKIERICAELDVIVRNDYANQHSLEPKREVRHA